MSYAKQTVVELRKEVAARGLSSSGLRKADLVNILLENDKADATPTKSITKSTKSSTSKKRELEEEEEEEAEETPTPKKIKVDKVEKAEKGKDKDDWQERGSLMYYTNCSGSTKIASFDLDDTLTIVKSKAKHAKDRNDWEWWNPCVPDRLRELDSQGFKIVIFTNQAGIAGKKKDLALAAQLQGKLKDIIKELGIVVHVYMATKEDSYRKPNTSMWDVLVEHNGEHKIDMKSSFYVGDAAGRIKGSKKDFSCSDRKFAFNVGVTFMTPEEFFLKEKAAAKFDWEAINFEKVLAITGDEIEGGEAAVASDKPEVVVFVGYPGSGKSTMAKRLIAKGYVHVNQDTLKDFERCLRVAREAINEGKSVVVDNTNPSLYHRKPYVQYAKKAGMQSRCFLFPMDVNLAKHLNQYRERKGEKNHVPGIAYNMFKSQYEEPAASEGFNEIKKIRFVPKFMNDDEKRLFCKYA